MSSSPEQFIRVWQTSKSLGEVARLLHITPQSAKSKASRYRKRGIPLSNMAPAGAPRLDAVRLAQVARECGK